MKLVTLHSTFAIFTLVIGARSLDIQNYIPGSANAGSGDSCHLRELELCSLGIMSIFQNPNGLPATQAELSRQCEFFNESIQCLDDYNNRCLPSNTIKIVEMFSESANEVIREFCRVDSDLRRNYTRHISCFREIQRDHQRHCMTDFQVGFEGIHKLKQSKRLQLACCNLGRVKECIFGPIDEECGLAATQTIENLLEIIFGGIYQYPCRTYNSTNPECIELLPKINTKPHQGRNISAISKIITSFTNVPAQLL